MGIYRRRNSGGGGGRRRRNLANWGCGWSNKWKSWDGSGVIIFLGLILACGCGVNGLECYECLSLNCPSGAVCASIKRTMQEIFVPKGHIIHFQPEDQCPDQEDPSTTNFTSPKWASLSKECQRSDSVCLVSPIEIISTLDGSRSGKGLEPEFKLTTTGYLRGCASRRKLQENEPTIKVNVNLLSKSSGRRNDSSSSSSHSSSHSSSGVMQASQDLEMEFDLSKLRFDDGYQIKMVHSHEFYIDQGTENATKCLEDRCNTKIKYRGGSSRVGGGSGWLLGVVVAVAVSLVLDKVC